MITGFNTDVKYDGITYHVQTEDKGLDTHLILSLIYQGGTILAIKRSTYKDLLIGSFDEKILAERLNRQHELLCAAIRAGRIKELKRMAAKDSAERKSGELKIKLIGGDIFKSGEDRNINILVYRGVEENAVKDVKIIVKILSSSFQPLIFHSKTDSNGIANLMLKIPSFKTGRAAILVRAIIKGEKTEIRRMILHEV